jgi:hypothetical protein
LVNSSLTRNSTHAHSSGRGASVGKAKINEPQIFGI